MQLGSENYLASDVRGLSDLKRQAAKNSPEALKEAARQFEGQFFKMMLKSMRDTNAIFEKDNFMHSDGEGVYRDMMDDQLVDRMTRAGSIGLSDMIVEQMQRASIAVQAKDPQQLNQPQRNDFLSAKFRQAQLQAATPNNLSPSQVADISLKDFSEPQQFVEKLMPYAKKAAAILGVKPQVLLAQAALETGWGKKIIKSASGVLSNNLFNIKADQRWEGERVQVSTLEFRDGVAQKEQAHFRAYPDLQSSFDDYVNFISNSSRYNQALEKSADSEKYLDELQKAGYATDPNYAKKIKKIMSGEYFSQTEKMTRQGVNS